MHRATHVPGGSDDHFRSGNAFPKARPTELHCAIRFPGHMIAELSVEQLHRFFLNSGYLFKGILCI